MNGILYIIGLGILGKGIFDFQSAFLGTTTFNDVISKDMFFEVTYYYFGFLYGAVCYYIVSSVPLKTFASTVGFICLCISAFAILDSEQETRGAMYDCVSLPPDSVDDCLEKLNITN